MAALRGGRGDVGSQERTVVLGGSSRETELMEGKRLGEEKGGWVERIERAAEISEKVRGSRGWVGTAAR